MRASFLGSFGSWADGCRFIIPFMKESPRWLATKHKNELVLANLAWIRKTPLDDPATQAEYAEIIASIEEEEAVADGRSWKEVLAKGNRLRFFIAFIMFTFQQASLLSRHPPASA